MFIGEAHLYFVYITIVYIIIIGKYIDEEVEELAR